MRLSMDLMVPEDSPVTGRQYNQLAREFEEYARVVLVPAAGIPIIKSGETHVTVHNHNSSRAVSCVGCLQLSDDEYGNQ